MKGTRSVAEVLLVVALCLALLSNSGCRAEQCGRQANWALCGDNLCCSEYGWCGTGDAYCGKGCQSGCTPAPTPPSGGVSAIITDSVFDQFLSQRSSGSCPANGFYTRSAFLSAAAAYNGFGTSDSSTTQKRELAAFFANIAHESGSGCYKEEIAKGLYCDTSLAPCAAGQQYYGRGPIQITWNYNYRTAGNAIGFDGINNPGIVASDPTISFKTAVWYWMTQHSPTCHAAITGGQGFGATINAINGGLECGPAGNKAQQQARISNYKSFCSILGVDPGDNLTC